MGSGMAASTPLDTSRPRTTRPQNYAVPGQVTMTLIFAFIVIAALYFARDLLMPFALAVLLSFMLAPLVRRLQKWYVPRGLAVIAVALFAFAVIFAIGRVIVNQVNQLAADLPQYQTTLRDKIQSLRGAAGASGTLERACEVLQDLSNELNRPNIDQQRNAQPWPTRPAGQANPCRGARTRWRPAVDTDVGNYAADPSAGDDRAGVRLRDLHPLAKAGSAQQARTACRFQRS